MPGPLQLILSFLLLLGIDFYFYQALKRTLPYRWLRIRKLILLGYYAITAWMCILTAYSFFEPFQQWSPFMRIYGWSLVFTPMICKLLGLIWLLIDDVRRGGIAVARLLARNKVQAGPRISRSAFLNRAAVLTAAVPFMALTYGMLGPAFQFQFRRKEVFIDGLPDELDGYTITQLSDMHLGSFIHPEKLFPVFDKIMENPGNLIVMTGDLVNNTADEAQPFIHQMKKLRAPDGVFSVLGNHDYGDYVRWDSPEAKAKNFDDLLDTHTVAGWKLLRNEHAVIEHKGKKIGLIGVENWGKTKRFPRYGDIKKASKGMPEVDVQILLSHDPSHWDAIVRPEHPDIHLTLSGHTHGMQFGIEIPGFRWSPSKYLYKQWADLYQEGPQQIYVNRGLGFLGYPGRVGILPEISQIVLKSGTKVSASKA